MAGLVNTMGVSCTASSCRPHVWPVWPLHQVRTREGAIRRQQIHHRCGQITTLLKQKGDFVMMVMERWGGEGRGQVEVHAHLRMPPQHAQRLLARPGLALLRCSSCTVSCTTAARTHAI
jgi:hypothetical protein